MRLRKALVGLGLVALFGTGLALRVSADPLVPGTPDVPGGPALPVPAVGVPPIDPNHPQIPPLPYVPIPDQLRGLTNLLSPVIPPVCTASYLLPLAGAVVMTAIFQNVPAQPPVPPSFINPLFGPVTTACVLADFPLYASCGPDAQITDALASAGSNVPNAGSLGVPVPVVDPFANIPAPFASLVNELLSIQGAILFYSGTPSPVDVGGTVAANLGCTTRR